MHVDDRVEITPDAEGDIFEIARFTEKTRGRLRRVAYVSSIMAFLSEIADMPSAGKPRDDIMKGV